MNNLNTFTNFRPITWQPIQDNHDNHSGNCHTRIQKTLPFWINNTPFWTYRCCCCSAYKFEKGKTESFANWGGIYD